MKFGTQAGVFGSDRQAGLKAAREFGCEGLEVGLGVADIRTGKTTEAEVLKQAEEIRRDFDAAGMEIISVTPGIILKHVAHPAVIAAACRAAVALGTRQVRMFFSPHVRLGGPNYKLDDWTADFDGTKDARYWMDRDGADLAELMNMSSRYDVRFVFELHHGFWVNSASAAMRMFEGYPAHRVGVLFDPGNMVFEGNEGWRNSVQILEEYIGYFHCKNAAWRRENDRWVKGWAGLEDGIADYAEIVTALKDIGFKGYLSIEDLRGNVPVEERIGRGIAYLKGLAASDVRVMPQ